LHRFARFVWGQLDKEFDGMQYGIPSRTYNDSNLLQKSHLRGLAGDKLQNDRIDRGEKNNDEM